MHLYLIFVVVVVQNVVVLTEDTRIVNPYVHERQKRMKDIQMNLSSHLVL